MLQQYLLSDRPCKPVLCMFMDMDKHSIEHAYTSSCKENVYLCLVRHNQINSLCTTCLNVDNPARAAVDAINIREHATG